MLLKLITTVMSNLHDTFIAINNQLLFVTEEQELNILLHDILRWNSTSSTIESLSVLSRYYTYEGIIYASCSFAAIIAFSSKYLQSELSQSAIRFPLSFLLSLILYILTNPRSIQSPHIPLLLQHFNKELEGINTYPIIFHSLVFMCLFLQQHTPIDDDRILFVVKYAMVVNSTAVLQFVV